MVMCRVQSEAQPQHLAVPSLVSIELTPTAGLSVTRFTPVSKKSLPSVGFGLVAGLGEGCDRLDAERSHQQRILLRRGADHSLGDRFFTPGQPPSTETIRTLPSMPTALSAS